MENHEKSCPFCLPVNHKLIFLSSSLFYAIYNRSPILPGHSLIIPVRHVSSLNQLTNEELMQMMVFTKEVTNLLKRVFRAPHFNWTIQDGASAGQTVDHLHIHVIPRKEGDLPDPGDWYPLLAQSEEVNIDSNKRKKHSYNELLSITKKLRESNLVD